MSSGRARIEIPRERVADFCRRLSGTLLGFAFFDVQEELSQILGRRVDLRTPRELSKYFRDEVLGEAEDVYVAA